jgi:hypothetical protein
VPGIRVNELHSVDGIVESTQSPDLTDMRDERIEETTATDSCDLQILLTNVHAGKQ